MTPETRFAIGAANPHRATVMYPPSRDLFQPFARDRSPASIAASLAAATGPLALYVHVPFCETKCTYCDYATVPLARHDPASIDRYVDGLLAELETSARALPASIEIAGLDLGGGTPGVLNPLQFSRILRTVERLFRLAPTFEVSTETTPTLAAADPGKWRAIHDAGVTRVSMGVQTTEPSLLTKLNRAPHAGDVITHGFDSLRAAGFAMVNLDLMFALPGLSLDRWLATVDRAIGLGPDVITIYDTVYKNRGIATQAPRWNAVPSQDVYGAQYDAAFDRLVSKGFSSRYGSVNFTRTPGRLGTSRYLEARLLDGADYLGVGLYASSLVRDTWRFGVERYDPWVAAAESKTLSAEAFYDLPRAHVMAKYLLLALSFGYLDAAKFARRFGEHLDVHFAGELALLESRGLLRRASDGWEMVPGSFAHLPAMRAVFLPDDAIDILERPVFAAVSRAAG